VVPIPERNFMTYQLVHEKTGARLFHVDCSDTNNVFWLGSCSQPLESSINATS
jgi:Zn-dependent M16 (insulinase) family peptidase